MHQRSCIRFAKPIFGEVVVFNDTDHMAVELAHHLVPDGLCTLQELRQRLTQTEENKDEFLRNLDTEGLLYPCFAILKEKWFYVDVENGEVTTPFTWSREDAEKGLSMAQKRLKQYEVDIAQELG